MKQIEITRNTDLYYKLNGENFQSYLINKDGVEYHSIDGFLQDFSLDFGNIKIEFVEFGTRLQTWRFYYNNIEIIKVSLKHVIKDILFICDFLDNIDGKNVFSYYYNLLEKYVSDSEKIQEKEIKEINKISKKFCTAKEFNMIGVGL